MLALRSHYLGTADHAIQRGFIDNRPQMRRVVLVKRCVLILFENLLTRHPQGDRALNSIIGQNRPD
jgi:hypothetical protein